MRTFISIHPDEEAIHKISLIQKHLKEKLQAIGEDKFNALKWETVDKFHMTLFFIGETEKNISEQMSDRLSQIEMIFSEIKFCTGNISAFPNLRFPRVVILEMIEKDGKLVRLVEEIRKAMIEFGLSDDKPFRPHITLARVRRDRKINLTGMIEAFGNPIEFLVNSFCLYQSILQPSGSVYKKLKEFRFGAANG
ncbi:MAG: RNA 2',3'-cyclic phosphodiesterase [Ignavibacteria bacterium]|nr:RNA 2',3'-cyclic phosphodiesterase [Ignavibacteria bacterium]